MLYSKFDYLNQETVFSARKIGSPDGDPEGVPNEGPEGVHQGVQIGGGSMFCTNPFSAQPYLQL